VLAKNIPQKLSFIPGKKIYSWDDKYLGVPANISQSPKKTMITSAALQQQSGVKIISSKKAIRFSDEEIDIPSQ
jgi:sporulation protein YlmC with PRC-barrel domain